MSSKLKPDPLPEKTPAGVLRNLKKVRKVFKAKPMMNVPKTRKATDRSPMPEQRKVYPDTALEGLASNLAPKVVLGEPTIAVANSVVAGEVSLKPPKTA